MRKLILNVVLFAITFSLGVFTSVMAMRCDRGTVLLVNTLDVAQPDLRLFGSHNKQTLLWAGSIPPGGVEELILRETLGSNLVLEGTNAATGQRFSKVSYYVKSLKPYGTYMYLIEPYGVRSIVYGDQEPTGKNFEPRIYSFLRLIFLEVFYETRCIDENLRR